MIVLVGLVCLVVGMLIGGLSDTVHHTLYELRAWLEAAAIMLGFLVLVGAIAVALYGHFGAHWY